MILSFFGLKASGLKRSHAFFVILKRFFTPSRDKVKNLFSFLFLIAVCTYFLLSTPNTSSHTSSFLLKAKSVITDLTAPALKVLNNPLGALENYLKTNDILRTRIHYLEEENHKLTEWKNLALKKERENKHLSEMLHVIPEGTVDFKTARVLGTPNDYYHSTLIISTPTDHSLKKNFAVICPKGVVGRVIEVGLSTARVMLATDIGSRIPVRFESGEQAILAGQNTDELVVTHRHHSLLSAKDSLPTIHVGDTLVTSGFGGIYPPNLPVAVVTRIDHDRIFAKLPYETGRLEYVMILTHSFDDDLQ